ncbi:MAG: DUF624 domain-containing protein [Lachnospiraceae bacterium]|nr:DUF624 domain-containing protein [Lachnospiraceae bacterium]
MKFFSVDSPLYNFMRTLMNLFLLNLCFLIGSIPLVTIGTSALSVYDVTLRMVDDTEGYVIKQYIKAFKGNLKQGILLELVTLVCAAAMWMDIRFLVVMGDAVPIYVIMFTFVAGFVFTLSLIYAYPQAARYKNSVFRIIQNSFRISMKFFGRTILLVFIVALEVFLILWNYTTMFVGIILGFSTIMYTISAFALPIFNKIEKGKQAGDDKNDGKGTDYNI